MYFAVKRGLIMWVCHYHSNGCLRGDIKTFYNKKDAYDWCNDMNEREPSENYLEHKKLMNSFNTH